MLAIAVIGPRWMEKETKEAFAMFPNISHNYLVVDELKDIIKVTTKELSNADCLLYTHQAYYKYARDVLSLPIPSYYIPLKGGGFYQALLQLPHHSLTSISIDGVESAYIERPLKKLNKMCQLMTVVLDLQDEANTLQQHIAYCQSPTHAVVTSSKRIADQLLAQNITAVVLKPTHEDIVVVIERILLSTEQRRKKEDQIVLGKIEIPEIVASHDNFKAQSLTKYKIDRVIANFTDEVNGYLLPTTSMHYIFICHRGEFERITEGYKILNLLSEINKVHPSIVYCGVGFGITIQAAAVHADLALKQAQPNSISCAFIVTEKRNVFGPITIEAPVIYSLAEKIIINNKQAYQIEKVKTYLQKNEMTIFTSTDVAQIIKITVRTANRLLVQWLDAEIIEMYGIERVNRKGRPRQSYRFIT